MIRVMTEQQIRNAAANIFWRAKDGKTWAQNRFELEYGYYIVELTEVNGRDRIEVIAPGPYVDIYSARHIAVTQHGMQPADGSTADEQNILSL